MTENKVPKLMPDQNDDDRSDKRKDNLSEPSTEHIFSFLDPLRVDPNNYEDRQPLQHPDTQMKARLLHGYCISSGKKVTESVNSLFAIAEHYSGQNPGELDSPEVINGIPIFFKSLSSKDKSEFCYNQVTKELSVEALPVTINSLLATRRTNPNDPTSSVAGRFVRRVTQYVCVTLLFLFALYIAFVSQNFLGFGDQAINHETPIVQWTIWVGFGCVGALVHLLNNALTTTRLQTFDASEERKVGPRLLLGGLFGFVLPWLISATSTLDLETGSAIGSVAAFFAGYSVRFSIGLLERLLEALLPETKSKS